jgi:hypothetical protein
LETAIVLSMADAGATPDRPHLKLDRVVRQVAERFGFGRKYAYAMLCDLARPWLTPMPLVDFHGNYGSPDFPASEPSLSEGRLSPAGSLAAAAELAATGPVPAGLINGTVYQGGQAPPFRPGRIVQALLTALDDPLTPDQQLASIAGRPAFPGGCQLDGDIDGVLSGRPARLILRSRLTPANVQERRWIDVTHLPPEVGPAMLVDYLTARREGSYLLVPYWPYPEREEPRLPFGQIENLTNGPGWGKGVLVRCHLEPEADMAVCRRRLRATPGICIDVEAQLPHPLGALLRSWAEDHRTHDAPLGLRALERIVRQ